MSDEIKDPKNNLRILEFDTKKKERTEANEIVAAMFTKLSQRALDGDINDFVMTFRSESRGIESMIGGTIRGFDFVGYLGMLELLKQRLFSIMNRMSYSYEFEKDTPSRPEDKEKKDEPTDPEKTDI